MSFDTTENIMENAKAITESEILKLDFRLCFFLII